MAKNIASPGAAPAPPQGAGTGARPGPGITEDNIAIVEKETMSKVSQAISALEGAMAKWDASKDKPEDLEPKFMKYRRFHEALVQWQTKMLKSAGMRIDFYSRVDRLKEFAGICYAYQ